MKSLHQYEVNILVEPFFLKLLQRIYAFRTKALQKKTHIPIDKGCLLVGIPDPLEVLQEDQVFLCIRKRTASGTVTESFEDKVITGKVLIYRNPCLHPGDVRIVEAVDIEALHYWKNVVILPCRPGISRSLADECSGGDLDGDRFAVVWDDQLIPNKSREYKSFEPISEEKTKCSGDGKPDEY
jgi:hypothetical protein